VAEGRFSATSTGAASTEAGSAGAQPGNADHQELEEKA
jgi:hypothetical protein